MDSALIAYGLGLLLITTVFWAAVWWWLPALFRDRDERRNGGGTPASRPSGRAESSQGDQPAAQPPKPDVRR